MLNKYYSMDECYQKSIVHDHLEELQSEGLITFEFIDSDIFKIKDICLSEKQIKELVQFFDNNDVIDYQDFDDDQDDDDDDYDDGFDDYRPNDNYF